jgi:hypothetical protein
MKQEFIVDAAGAPLVLYHGTDVAFSKFKPSVSAFYGGGIYFTDDLEAARGYAEDKGGDESFVMSAHVVMRKPYVFESGYAFEEPTAVSLIKRLFKGEARRRVLTTFEEQGSLTDEISSELASRGYDGLIVRVPSEPDEYVVFDPGQIRIVQANVEADQPRQRESV